MARWLVRRGAFAVRCSDLATDAAVAAHLSADRSGAVTLTIDEPATGPLLLLIELAPTRLPGIRGLARRTGWSIAEGARSPGRRATAG